jgi:predicted methyltransferase
MSLLRVSRLGRLLAMCTALACFFATHAGAGDSSSVLPPSAFPNPGRPVAGIVSPIWHREDERDAAKEVPQVVRFLGIEAGMTVADIGAGSGYYAVRLSPLIGERGKIFAEDVTPGYLRLLEAKIRDLHLRNVAVTLGEPHDPKLPPRSLDRAILVHMYHEVSQPFALLYNLAAALKPGAKIGIVDATRPILEHGTPPGLLRCELEAMGYKETAFHPLEGSEAYLAIFELPAGNRPAAPGAIVPCNQQ